MKKIIYISLFLVMATINAYSQQAVANDLPTTTGIIHYKLQVGYNTTTVLIFPAPVKQADRGERDLLIQKQAAVENVLKVKAARKDFAPTNLHVFTGDGRVYAFDVSYTTDPPQTTYDLSKLLELNNVDENPKDRIEISNKPLDKEELAKNIAKVKAAKPFFFNHSSKYKMKVQLQTIFRLGNLLFLGLKITNRSSLPYSINCANLYIQDKKRARRSSIQQRGIIPIYNDSIAYIPGKSETYFVMTVPQFTIPDHREMIFEILERNGDRSLKLGITNRQLFEAREL